MATIAELITAIENSGGLLKLGALAPGPIAIIQVEVFGPEDENHVRDQQNHRIVVADMGGDNEQASWAKVLPEILMPDVEPPPAPVPVGTDEEILQAVMSASGTKILKSTPIKHTEDGAEVTVVIDDGMGKFFEVLCLVTRGDGKGLVAYLRKNQVA